MYKILIIAIFIINVKSNILEEAEESDIFEENASYSLNVQTKELRFTGNGSKNITFNIILNNVNETDIKLDIYFESGPQLKELQNLTNIIINDNVTNFTIKLDPINPGHTILHIYAISSTNSSYKIENFVLIDVRRSSGLFYLEEVVGWLYFIFWSISFYPQIILNYKRKSVVGLHFDFLSLNILGFFCYSIFNVGLFWVPLIQNQYYMGHPYGINPVRTNDVIFSLHALLAASFTGFQCLMYDRGDQMISRIANTIISCIIIFIIVFLMLALTGAILWLQFIYWLSYIKLFITLIKYIPQAFYNHQRRSTCGWSIGNILLDFSGGLLSIFQMFILSYNYDDWGSIFGDPSKFGLGLFSIIFDIVFILQHYIFYKDCNSFEKIEEPDETEVSTMVNSDTGYGSTTVEQ